MSGRFAATRSHAERSSTGAAPAAIQPGLTDGLTPVQPDRSPNRSAVLAAPTSVLVAVGTQHFDALVAEVDSLVQTGRLPANTFGQIGSGTYLPHHFPWVRYERNLWQRLVTADLIITHGGTGLVMECIQSGRPFIAVPDELKPKNHQLEFLEALAERFDYCWARRPTDLETVLPHARPARRKDARDVRELARDILTFVQSGQP